jgi:ABC-2 type transport system permease protein
VIERQRVSPASRVALLAGRVLRDVIVLVVQATLLTLTAIPFGLRAPWGGVILAIVVVGGLGAGFASLSYAAALRLKSEDALAPLFNGLAIPVLLLSGILLPMTLGPRWLQHLAALNPFRHIVDAARVAFSGNFGDSSLVIGLVCAAVLAVVGLAVATRTFQRESA